LKFLGEVAKLVYEQNPEGLEKVAVVFPSIRAGLFFKQELSKLSDKAFFSPEVFSIEEFASKIANIVPADRLRLIFELFKVYKNFFGNETFDNFYNWGAVILKDFDDIDKNLVNAKELFRIIKAYKEIDEEFKTNLDDYESYQAFWETFSKQKKTNHKTSFIELWKKLYGIYTEFTKVLREKKTAYQGLIFREASSIVLKDKFSIGHDKIYFAGFNYITKSEKLIMQTLKDRNDAQILWNADQYYINDIPDHEAGSHLRKNFKTFGDKDLKWISNNFSNTKKISIYSTGLKIAQTKVITNILNSIENPGVNTAIVLPTDSMLSPILNSIPEDVKSVNVSMGYPLRYNSFHSLIKAYIKLHSDKRTDSSGDSFYFKDVFRVLFSNIIFPLYRDENESFKILFDFKSNITKQRITYINKDLIPASVKVNNIVKDIFKPVESVSDIFNNIESIILGILDASYSTFYKFETEFINTYLQFLRNLKGILTEYETELDLETFWKLYMDVIREYRLPLKGEPLEGLQILGLLETRNLSFENVLVLSFNEKILPGGKFIESFIPFNLKKSFGINTFEDLHNSSANYFYNLIKDAKNIHLIYLADTTNEGDGEVSRYMTQLKIELPKLNNQIELEYFTIDSPEGESGETVIEVKKYPEMFKKYYSGEKLLSPSAINNFVNCSLKFYLSNILELFELEKFNEEIDAKTIGNILHEVMNQLYSDYINADVDCEIINKLRAESNSMTEAVMSNEPFYIKDSDTGYSLITKKIIQGLVNRLLEADKKYAPFKILQLENSKEVYKTPVKVDNGEIFIGGKIDRIDLKDGITRIVDYKTGKVDFSESGDKEISLEKISTYFSDPKYKEILQTYIYSYIYRKSTGTEKFKVTLLSLKSKKEITLDVISENLEEDKLRKFEDNLINLISEIFNLKNSFKQTDDVKRCNYCPYKSICGR